MRHRWRQPFAGPTRRDSRRPSSPQCSAWRRTPSAVGRPARSSRDSTTSPPSRRHAACPVGTSSVPPVTWQRLRTRRTLWRPTIGSTRLVASCWWRRTGQRWPSALQLPSVTDLGPPQRCKAGALGCMGAPHQSAPTSADGMQGGDPTGRPRRPLAEAEVVVRCPAVPETPRSSSRGARRSVAVVEVQLPPQHERRAG